MLLKGAYCVGEQFVDPQSSHAKAQIFVPFHTKHFDQTRWMLIRQGGRSEFVLGAQHIM